ncbi:hypothetical protein EDD30_3488 [Couchioplanes caeruleus]|uniref:Uncharacterized protein n=2 Tax=Couchioplanes caeruleus TaxID=56438 RepID=A0A3N1GK84_9ACTN|nr:hypothetical protein EDD30_3488 [Couchioplanes caeruleus]
MMMVVAALLALLFLPCAVAIVACADALPWRRLRTRGGRDVHALRRLDRRLNADGPLAPPPVSRPGVEELAADLRRLARQRRGGPTVESAAWLAAVMRAYDHRLSLASEALGLPHHLAVLDGMDLDLERMRVEEELRAAGMRLR